MGKSFSQFLKQPVHSEGQDGLTSHLEDNPTEDGEGWRRFPNSICGVYRTRQCDVSYMSGHGRTPRGQENQLVALIPYSDQRLRPRRTVTVTTTSSSHAERVSQEMYRYVDCGGNTTSSAGMTKPFSIPQPE